MTRKTDRGNVNDTSKMYLLSEVQSRCPLCNCPLIVKKTNKSNIRVFDVAHIYPLNPTEQEKQLLLNEEKITQEIDSEDNFITLCKICHKKYDTNKTVDDYRQLVAIKKEILKIKEVEGIWNNQSLHQDISIIAEKISALNTDDMQNTELSLDALSLSNKTNDTFCVPNRIKTEAYIKMYYTPIKESFKILELENKARTDFIFQQVKSYYLALKMKGLNQDEIYENMCEWFKMKTNIDKTPKAEILVSFFIQNCEIFS